MSQPKSPTTRVTSVRGARIVLVALLLAWGALLLWTLRHGERLLVASTDATSMTGIVASGAPPNGSPSTDDADRAPIDDEASLAAATSEADASGDVDDAAAGNGENGDATGDTVAESGEREAVGDPAADEARAEDPDTAATAPPGLSIGGRETSAAVAASGVAGGDAEAPGAQTADPGRVGDRDGSDTSYEEDKTVDGAGSPVPDGREAASAGPGPDVDIGTDADADGDAESVFEVRRREELATLSTLLEGLRFEPLGSAPSADSRAPLERAFEILFLYPDTRLELVVAGRESDDAAFDRRLGDERADALVDYLVSRGIERGRLSARGSDGAGLPFGEHRVRVTVEDENR